MSVAEIDAELAAMLAPYGVSPSAYLQSLENPPRLPPGTIDSRAYLARLSDLKERIDQASTPELERQMWEFTLLTRPIDGVAFRMRMTRLLRARCEVVQAKHTAEAKRLMRARDEREQFRRKSF